MNKKNLKENKRFRVISPARRIFRRGSSMHLNIKEAARRLGVSENKVRAYIASGILSVERKGRQILIPEAQLGALTAGEKGLDDDPPKANPDSERANAASCKEALDLMSARLAALESQLVDKWQIVVENQRLHQLLRDQDRRLAEKDLEIEKLRRDLVYQQRLCDKELEDHHLASQERQRLVERAASESAAQESQRLEQALVQERQIWSQKLAQEQERFAQMLASMRNQEGFWARLMRMITWS